MKKRQGPGLYTDIGKNIRGLLYQDFTCSPKLSVTATNSNQHHAITCVATQKSDCLYVGVGTFSQKHSTMTYAKLNTSSGSFSNNSINEIKFAPGLKGIVGVHPFQNSYMMGIQYKNNFTGCTTGLKLSGSPVIDFSGVIGTNVLSFGTDVSFNIISRNFTKCNFGWSLLIKNTNFTMTLDNKGDTVKASYYQSLRPITNTTIGIEIAGSFSTHNGDAVIGVEHVLNQLTRLKARLSVYGIASAMIQHELWPKTRVLLCGDFDTKDMRRLPKVGVALDLKFTR